MTDPVQNENPGMATPEEMSQAIDSSGYLIEARVARVLTESGFFVQQNIFSANPNDATKAIETDVVGRSFEWVNETSGSTASASVLVECKNNNQPFAFFLQNQRLPELNDNWILYGGFPSYSLDPETKIHIPLHKLLEMQNWHHYCASREVATQFCSFNRNGKKWKAEPNENYSKSFSNLAAASARDWEGAFGLHLQSIQVQLTYPVVVFQGPIYCVFEEQGRAIVEAASHIQLHHSAIVDGELLKVQIDVVTESEFTKLLSTIRSELRVFRDRINLHYERLLNSAVDQKRVASMSTSAVSARREVHPGRFSPRL